MGTSATAGNRDECRRRSSARPGSDRSTRPHAEEAANEQGRAPWPAREPHLVIVTDKPHILGMEEQEWGEVPKFGAAPARRRPLLELHPPPRHRQAPPAGPSPQLRVVGMECRRPLLELLPQRRVQGWSSSRPPPPSPAAARGSDELEAAGARSSSCRRSSCRRHHRDPTTSLPQPSSSSTSGAGGPRRSSPRDYRGRAGEQGQRRILTPACSRPSTLPHARPDPAPARSS
jgi:hypothetical protein